jgi:hypothetical protein
MTATIDTATHAPPPDDDVAARPAFAARPVFAIVGAFVALELAVAARYGIHRDELYFLACARHLAWGYVDQPPFVVFVARLAVAVGGPSAFALRLVPAIAGGAAVAFGAMMARELGGRRRAQVFAAIAGATSGVILATAHLLSTATFDLFFWSLLCLLVLRLLRTRDERLWLAIGVTAGVALMNKYNVLFLLAALAIALLTNREHRPLLRSRWLLLGVAVAVAIVAPNIVWNAQHDWAAVSMLHSLHSENSTLGASVGFVPGQLFIVGPALLFLWIAGLRRLFSHPTGRVFAVAYVALLAVDILSGAKPYYLSGIYFVLFAGGGLWYEERVARRSRAHPARTAAIFVVAALVALPLALPVLPASAQPKGPWLGNINKDLSATLGWKPFVHQVAGIAGALPASERRRLVIFTGDYGAAGAVDRYGAQYGLPHAISGHNSYWWWGWGHASNHSTTIAVNMSRSYLRTMFADVELVGHVRTPGGVWTEERGAPIYLCRGQLRTWASAWASARHYG